jgi:acyl transferase domain-containing protein
MAGKTIQPPAEPIAIIGRSCRLPGAPDPDAYWDLLRNGRSGVRDLPASRLRPSGRGGFLDGIDEFDPEFFGISVREAGAMDPQQRLMLELSWEALEDAGIVQAALFGSDTGIYVGAMSSDYMAVARDHDISHHSMTGLARSLIPNRISHVLGLHGASLTVDAGQASSLVAVHLACQSLRGGDTGLALAGGVELSFAALSMTIAEQSGALSPDGECFTFDARANGYVRGEGAGVIILKPLARAIADQDRIRAVILGSAVNNDGGGKGLGVPAETAQREVLRLACEQGGVSPADVQYVELHGTGTSVGDPVEAAALGAVFGSVRPSGQALPVGSVKTNIGHLGSAAGIAGLLKVTLAIEHGQLPPSRNFVTPNPAIPLDELNLTIQDTLGERAPALAGVSAFSIGGTNCHVLLAAPPARPVADGPARATEPRFRAGATPVTVCGRSAAAVRAQARRLREHADANPQHSVSDLGFSLAVARTAFRHRAVILAATREELRTELTALEVGAKNPAQVSEAAGGSGRPVFVFPATVTWQAGPAASLLDSSDTFRASVRAADEAMRGYLGWSVEALLRGLPGTPRSEGPEVAGPTAFAVQTGLASVWRSFGIDPAAVVGEGAGLIAAAHVAGGLSLTQAARLASTRDGTPDLLLPPSTSQIPILTCEAGFGTVITSLTDHRAFIEISPCPVVATALHQAIEDAGSPAIVIESSCDGVHAPRALLGALATFHTTAGTVNWRPAFPPGIPVVSLPTYPFQRRRCWLGIQPDLAGAADAEGRPASGPLTAAEMLAVIQAETAIVLGASAAEDMDPDRAFSELGFDSITEVELAGRLATRTGLEIPPTAIFGYPSPAQLARHLHASGPAAAAAMTRAAPARRRAALSARPARFARTADDAVAIVSMACRYPGEVWSPEDLWRLALAGDDAMSGFPVNRGWNLDELLGSPSRPGTSAVRQGGFLHDADQFDAAFFGIGPREATAMDPQQRLLLHVAWEAIERAGIQPASLRGTPCGVFVGAMPQEYGPRMHEAPRELAGHLLTGSTTSVLSGRLAYTFGLEGPAVTVDTACSSSLVALHLAATALRQGECSLALVAGVTVMSSPGMFTEFSRQQGLAPDGRCKPFAAAADGTAWSEGAGVLVIERVADAARNNHQVLAIIRGSATNQDGASNGLTAPNGPAQEEVIRRALASAGLRSADVDAVEAHGTGTPLGDPIEAQAVLATYGQDRSLDRPLLLGSVKSHIGHTQAAAGIAGVVTMVQSIRHGLLPATAYLDAPSPHVNWTAGAVSLLTGNTKWPDTGRPKRAGISSFGISGSNAHVIIEEAPPDIPQAALFAPACLPWPVTARDDTALREMAGRLRAHVSAHGHDPARVSFSLATRGTFEHRAVTVALAADPHLSALDALAAGKQSPALITGTIGRRGPLAVMLTGQGSQHAGMGRELYRSYPVFAEAFDEACAAIGKSAGLTLPEVMFASPGSAEADLLRQTSYTQPALFALEVALYRLMTSFGLRADYLIGHSVGELTAAYLAGVLSLPDAAALVCARGALMQALSATGAMVSLRATESEVLPLLEGHEEDVSIAAVNGPTAVVISGTAQVVDGIAASWREGGGNATRLRVSHAFHSPHMDPMIEDFRELAAGLSYREPAIPVVSNVTGRLAKTSELASPDYWARHIRAAVRFHDGIRHLASLGVARYIELGPDAVLTNLARTCLGPAAVLAENPATGIADAPAPDWQPVIASVLAAGQPETVTFVAGLARLYVNGADVDWRGCFTGLDTRPVELPAYPFRGKRYWADAVPAGAGQAATAGSPGTGHPLLPGRVDAADGSGAVLTGSVSSQIHPWLADHVVAGEVLFPGTGFLELALHAARGSGTARVEELALEAPLVLPGQGTTEIQLVVGPETGSADAARSVSVHARSGASRPWTRHAAGALWVAGKATAQPPRESWPPAEADAVDVAGIYDQLAQLGYGYGPAFRGLRAAWHSGTDVFAEVALPPDQQATAAWYQLHPALMDAALHAAVGLLVRQEVGWVRVPFYWSGVTLYTTGADALLVRMSQAGPDAITMTLTDLAGSLVASVDRLLLRPVPAPPANAGIRPRNDQPPPARTAPATTPAAASAARIVPAADHARTLAAELAELPEAGQRRRLLALVLTGTAAALGYDSPDPIRVDQGFLDAGLDSLCVVELREILADATGLRLPETVAFDHSTPEALTEYLWRALFLADASESPPPITDPRHVGLSIASNEEIFDLIDNDMGIS